MNLRTATLISLTGIVACTITSLFVFFFQLIMTTQMHRPVPFWVHQVSWFLQIVLFNGGVILFLSVLYSKQKE
jgi:hypothetical protein